MRQGQLFLPGLVLLGRQYLAEAGGLLARAEMVRERRFAYLGRSVVFPDAIDWQPRDLTPAWRLELQSLDDLFALGVAARLAPTAEERREWYGVASGVIREWIAGAASGRGPAWELPGLARRIPNLLHACVFFAAELRLDHAQRRALQVSLYEQAARLAGEVADAPEDHRLIGAGRALFMAGRFFEGVEGRSWLDTGSGILWGQLREQIREDGGHRGRNPAWHGHALAHYLEVFCILRTANDDVPIWAHKRVKGMADFFARILHPDCEIPLFHGASIGMAPPPRELLATAAAVLQEPGLALPGPLPGIWPLLILGEGGRRIHANLPRRREEIEARALRRTGYYVLPGGPGDVMLLDGDSPPAGGHANALGYELSVGGLRLIVCSGSGSDEPAPWDEYFRSPRAHNVVSLPDAEQSATGRGAAVTEAQWLVRDGFLYFAAAQDGFAQPARDTHLRHRRRVFCLPGRFWLVCDEVLGSGACQAESFIHFHPEVALSGVQRQTPAFIAARSEEARIQVVTAGVRRVELTRGLEEPLPHGWYAAEPGDRRPAPVLTLRAGGNLPLAFGYALLPRADGPASLRLEHDVFRLEATLRVGAEEFLLSVVQGDIEMVARTV